MVIEHPAVQRVMDEIRRLPKKELLEAITALLRATISATDTFHLGVRGFGRTYLARCARARIRHTGTLSMGRVEKLEGHIVGLDTAPIISFVALELPF